MAEIGQVTKAASSTECFFCYRKAATVVIVSTIQHPEGEAEARCTRHSNGG